MVLRTLLLNYRIFLRSKSTFLINLIGLSSAFTAALLVLLWIQDELRFDKFHKNDERLFQVMENIQNSQGLVTRDATPIGMAELLLESLPEVEHAATVTPMAWFPKFNILDSGTHIKQEGKFVGKQFFNMFSYPLLYGNEAQVLDEQYSVVISEDLAVKLYGSTDQALGQDLTWELSHITKQCTVTGVFENVPSNSSEQFDLILPIDLLAEIMGFDTNEIGPAGPSTFLVLHRDADLDVFNDKISSLMASALNSKEADFFLVPYSSKYLFGKYENGVQTETRMAYVKLFGLFAILVICISCINFVNLTTARASSRVKEIGIKKIVGASRKHLILQYLGESILMCSLSLIAAICIAKLILPQFNQIAGKTLNFSFTVDQSLVYVSITLITGVLAGSYPALYLSGFKPAAVLKGPLVGSLGELMARKGLVVFQFAISIIAIAAALVIYKQMVYVQTKNLGYDKHNLIYFELEGKVAHDHTTFISEIQKVPGVLNASAMSGNIVGTVGHSMETTFNDTVIPFHWLGVDYGLIETLGIEMESGRTFSKSFNDSSRIIFNQAAIDAMGISDPIGKTIPFWNEQVEIIGVTKNFHLRSLHEEITPLAFRLERDHLWNIFVRIEQTGQQDILNDLVKAYKRLNPGFSLDYRFVDQYYESQYVSESRVGSLSIWFAGLTIIISCLGLFGLAAYSADRRTKEIGIRKVLGSTATGIVLLLCKDFLRPVSVAITLAIPLSYHLLHGWLANFAYSIQLEWWFIMVGGMAALLIAVMTTILQAVKVSSINPSKALRNE